MTLSDALDELATELEDVPAAEALDQLRESIPELAELCRHKWLLRLLLQVCD